MEKGMLWVPPAAGEQFPSAAAKHDAIAEEYEGQYDIPYWRLYDALTWAHMSEALSSLGGGRLLDAGGGTGRWARRLTGLGFDVDVVDPAERMLAVGAELAAREGLAERLRFIHGEVCDLPVGDAQYDAVICQGNPVSYCADAERALGELARAAKPGATVVVSVHNTAALLQYFCFLTGRLDLDAARALAETGQTTIDFPIRAFTPAELVRLCEAAGLRVQSLVGKQAVSGFVQTDAYQARLAEDFDAVVELEKQFWRDPSVVGLASHLEVACVRA